ncbi:IS66 family insertion sequence element accessory protein TnpB [Paraburkholderia terrae]
MIGLPAGTRIWIAAGVTDMRCSFQGLAAKVQSVLEDNPFGGDVFVFRGRREQRLAKRSQLICARAQQFRYRTPEGFR